MKTMHLLRNTILLSIVLGTVACESPQQATTDNTTSSEDVQQSVNSDRWLFSATQAMPQRGRTRMLNSDYEVICKADTFICYLPYMGRAYDGVAYGSTRGPLDFTSTDFKYAKQKDEKGRWNITINPNDNKEVRSMYFSFYDNGSAQLSVQFANRDAISFNGSVKKLNK